MRTLIVNNVPYSFPDQGQEPPWGEEVADWAQAVTDTIGGFISEGDVVVTTFSILNNQANQPITGFFFDSNSVQGFTAEYTIYRQIKDNLGATTWQKTEFGKLDGAYEAGNWYMAQTGTKISDTNVTLSIDGTGQILYTSTNETIPAGGTHNCKMVFRARALPQ